MLGAVIGDIAGSIYERHPLKQKPSQLFISSSHFTDDTVTTAAVAQGLLDARLYRGQNQPAWKSDEPLLTRCIRDNLQKFCRAYPNAGYGKSFFNWMYSNNPHPYQSWGNGSAMRASCCGWAANSLEEARFLARCSAIVTHDHPEGILGAQAVAEGIFLLRQGASKQQVKSALSVCYSLDFTLDEIRPNYSFAVRCKDSVPQAIVAFLEADSFEESIRLAISLGGDADTQAAIAGSLAEACYGISHSLRQQTLSRLPVRLSRSLLEAEAQFGTKVSSES